MKNFIRHELGAPKVVDRSIFQTELDALRVREKAHTHEGDAIAAARRRLPTRCSPPTRFQATLVATCDRRRAQIEIVELTS